MIAKIIIKRRFLPGKTSEILTLLNNMRTGAMDRPGYISGETLMQHNDPQCLIVICTWQSMQDWLVWKEDNRRKQFELMLEVYQEGPTVYEEYVLGTPLHQ
ncbi:MAG: antibiotic biosynthesis monooxygenase [Desulfobacteraceae bacterium]|nr:antibiotic biosynthesis monooxygenase [Desulfobacteraceae bacterium]